MKPQTSIGMTSLLNMGDTGTTPRNDFGLLLNRNANISIGSNIHPPDTQNNGNNLISPMIWGNGRERRNVMYQTPIRGNSIISSSNLPNFGNGNFKNS